MSNHAARAPWRWTNDDAPAEDDKLLSLGSRDFIGQEQVEDRFQLECDWPTIYI